MVEVAKLLLFLHFHEGRSFSSANGQGKNLKFDTFRGDGSVKLSWNESVTETTAGSWLSPYIICEILPSRKNTVEEEPWLTWKSLLWQRSHFFLLPLVSSSVTTFKRSTSSMVNCFVSCLTDHVCCLEITISWVLILQKQCRQKNIDDRIY